MPTESEKGTFAEVMAYLKGVADAVAAQSSNAPPVSSDGPQVEATIREPSAPPTWSSIPPFLLGQRERRSAAPRYSPVPSSGAYLEKHSLQFGELPYSSESAWPQVAVGAGAEPVRGGSRALEASWIAPANRATNIGRRYLTMPYSPNFVPRTSPALQCVDVLPQSPTGAPVSALATPTPSLYANWQGEERESAVRLRTAGLSLEWYELTGTVVAESG